MKRGKKAETERHSKACTCAECRGPGNVDTVAAIKDAHKNGRELIDIDGNIVAPKDEVVDLLFLDQGEKRQGKKRTLMLIQENELMNVSGKRGKRVFKSRGELFVDRRRGLYHTLVRLPLHHKSQRDDAAYMTDMVAEVVKVLQAKGERVSGGAVELEWIRAHPRQPAPHRSTICRYLKKLRK